MRIIRMAAYKDENCQEACKGKPSSSCSVASASSSDEVQPPDFWLSILLEEATSVKAVRIASACIASPTHWSKAAPRIGDRDPALFNTIPTALFRNLNKLSQSSHKISGTSINQLNMALSLQLTLFLWYFLLTSKIDIFSVFLPGSNNCSMALLKVKSSRAH